MNFKGLSCDYCGKPFQPDDDIVVCPECGTPQHRSCYNELGHCVHANRHAEGYAWKAPVREPSVPLEEQQASATPGEGYVLCSRCGTVNPSTNQYCDLCRYPLDKTGAKIPGGERKVEGENGQTTFAEYVKEQCNVNPEEKLSDELNAREVAACIGPNSLSFLYKFRNMLQRKNPVSFNIGAFFFTYFYCFYRKMYKVGLILLGITVLSYIPFAIYYLPYFQEMIASGVTSMAQLTTITAGVANYSQLVLTSRIAYYVGLVLNVLCGIFINYFYLKKVTRQVRNERVRGHAAAGTEQYYAELSRKGGTSGVSVLLLAVGMLFLSGVASYFITLG